MKKIWKYALIGGGIGVLLNYIYLFLIFTKIGSFIEVNNILLYSWSITHILPATIMSDIFHVCYGESCMIWVFFSYIFWIPLIGFLIGSLIGYLIKRIIG